MTEMIRELMIQSVGAFLAIFGFSLLVDMPRKYLVYAGITGGAGWLAYLVSMQVGTSQVAAAFFFQSGSGSAESGICTRVKSARHDLSGGRNPADGAGRIDLPERLFSDTGTDKMVQFLSDPDDPDSGGDGGCHLYCGFTVPSAPE